MKSNDNNSSVIITNIDAESTRGLIVDWNRHHPMEVVSEGDHITAVNNVECSPSTVRKLQKEFVNKQRLQLKIRKDVTYAKAPKVESHPLGLPGRTQSGTHHRVSPTSDAHG